MTHRITSPSLLVAALACALGACGDAPGPVAPTARAAFDRGGGLVDAGTPLHLNEFGTAVCGFPVYDAYEGRTKHIDLPGGGSIDIYPTGRQIFVNGLTGKTIEFSAAGTAHLQPLPDGGSELVIVGHNPLGLVVDGRSIFSIASGRFTIVFAADGSVVQPLGGVGGIVDACELLR